MKKNKSLKRITIFIYLLLVISILSPILREGNFPVKLGLDLTGGVIVSYRPDFSKTRTAYANKSKKKILETSKEIISERLERKLNTIPDVYISGDNRIIVNIPSVSLLEKSLI